MPVLTETVYQERREGPMLKISQHSFKRFTPSKSFLPYDIVRIAKFALSSYII
jgi:hypothetical protein